MIRAIDDKETISLFAPRIGKVFEKCGAADERTSRLTFLGHSKDSLWNVDLLLCESLILKAHWVMVIMDQYTQRIIRFAVHTGALDGPAVCRMFNCIIGSNKSPSYLSSDNDPRFMLHRWKANLRIFEETEVKTVPHVPLPHPFV